MNHYRVIGLMSGSSLDGLDITYCEFTYENNQWNFKILQTEVVGFSAEGILRIKSLPTSSAKEIAQAHASLGNYFGKCVYEFIQKNSLQNKVDFIASHGHTIFHFPEKGFTTQIGNGAAIAAQTNLPVVCDFRSADMANGGQGTPIVPIGDKLLFANYKLCLNIGGIANISCKTTSTNLSSRVGRDETEGEEQNSIVAFDICAANQVLNFLANTFDKEYDAAGEIAASGELNAELLAKLNAIKFCSQPFPKSLDNSFSREIILPLLEEFQISVEDKMRTYVEHIAIQIANHIQRIVKKEKINLTFQDKILVTGGGAFNTFLVQRIKAQTKLTIETPNEELVKFKESLVIAFMGVLRKRNEVNVLKSVTGAKKDTCGGAVYLP
jgi:anhydro-N-acetylmuramic acid kinase